ncbi:hypothetical protein ACO0K0_07295 [Undibacterium sp. SXout11W]|uniref:hypothetical protein n=1 Tax=Undibacterium sp. SXout11W TaxID=3413050 RepID=UPI003BF3D396
MTPLINRIQRAFILFQIRCLDRRYIRFSNDVSYYEQALIDNKEAARKNRAALLRKRSELRIKFYHLENN